MKQVIVESSLPTVLRRMPITLAIKTFALPVLVVLTLSNTCDPFSIGTG